MISSSASRYYDFKRRTAFVLDAVAAAASLTPDRSLESAAYLEVTVSGGTTGSGTVTLTGTAQGGAAQSETLTFTGNGVQQSTKKFATFTAMTTSGLANETAVPQVAVRSVSADGTPVLADYVVAAARPALLSQMGGASWPAAVPGTHEHGRAYLDVDYEEAWEPQVGDLVVDYETSAVWLVEAVDPRRVGFGVRPQHHRLTVKRRDT